MVRPDALAALRDRLGALREDTLQQLSAADCLDSGLLALLSNVTIGLAALDQLDNFTSCPQKRRGGDHKAAARAQRNSGMRDVAQLLGVELSLERQAQLVITKTLRYQPSPSDANGSPERQALHRIASSGVPVPRSKKQVTRIIAKK